MFGDPGQPPHSSSDSRKLCVAEIKAAISDWMQQPNPSRCSLSPRRDCCCCWCLTAGSHLTAYCILYQKLSSSSQGDYTENYFNTLLKIDRYIPMEIPYMTRCWKCSIRHPADIQLKDATRKCSWWHFIFRLICVACFGLLVRLEWGWQCCFGGEWGWGKLSNLSHSLNP